MLDVILFFNMARSVNFSRTLHSEKFDPIESFVEKGQCDDFRKYILDWFCEDCASTRGKKCDPSRAKLSLDGANDFKNFSTSPGCATSIRVVDRIEYVYIQKYMKMALYLFLFALVSYSLNYFFLLVD